MLGGSVWLWITTMSWWHIKMSLTLNKPNIESFLFKTPHSLQKWTKTHWRCKVLYSKPPTPGQKSSRVELKDNSSVLQAVNTSVSFWRPLKMFPSLVYKDKDDLRSNICDSQKSTGKWIQEQLQNNSQKGSSKLFRNLVVVYYTPADQNRESYKQSRPIQWCYAIFVGYGSTSPSGILVALTMR